MSDALRALIGRRLEAGTRSPVARAVAAAWGAASARAVARPLRLPEGARIVGVGGAVLGGAGKTPLAIAIAGALAERGERAALIGHAYRARPARARVVRPDDAVAEVGDDALAAARMLEGMGAAVIVAPRRQDAIDHAAALGHRVLVVDGLLQAAPRRIDLALLTLDALAPWGAGACPPAGDLKAPREALLAAADRVAAILPEGAALSPELVGLGAVAVPSRIAGAVADDGRRIPLAALAGRRLGLIAAVARPGRILVALAAGGVRPVEVVLLGDHDRLGPGALTRAVCAGVEGWLTTARCATKLPPRIGGAPVLALEQRLDVGGLAGALPAPAPGARAAGEGLAGLRGMRGAVLG